jgi:hypothetical protein
MWWCQLAMVFLHATGFLGMVYYDIHGRSSKEPTGFAGVVATMVLYSLSTWLMYGAGVFSQLFN